jgi:hypothetical protein
VALLVRIPTAAEQLTQAPTRDETMQGCQLNSV